MTSALGVNLSRNVVKRGREGTTHYAREKSKALRLHDAHKTRLVPKRSGVTLLLLRTNSTVRPRPAVTALREKVDAEYGGDLFGLLSISLRSPHEHNTRNQHSFNIRLPISPHGACHQENKIKKRKGRISTTKTPPPVGSNGIRPFEASQRGR